MELTALCLEDQRREAFDKTDENTVPDNATLDHIPQKGLHLKKYTKTHIEIRLDLQM